MSQQTALKAIGFLYECLVWCCFSTGLCNCMHLQFSMWRLRLCKCVR